MNPFFYRILISFTLLLTLGNTVVLAQGTVSGQIVDAQSGEELIGATVQVEDTGTEQLPT